TGIANVSGFYVQLFALVKDPIYVDCNKVQLDPNVPVSLNGACAGQVPTGLPGKPAGSMQITTVQPGLPHFAGANAASPQATNTNVTPKTSGAVGAGFKWGYTAAAALVVALLAM